jgi:hypothetical protein
MNDPFEKKVRAAAVAGRFLVDSGAGRSDNPLVPFC